MPSIESRFTKVYRPPNGRRFVHTAMVRHQGVVVAFALDDARRISYTVRSAAPEEDPKKTPEEDPKKTPEQLELSTWSGEAKELVFPSEIVEVGFGVARPTRVPVRAVGAPAPSNVTVKPDKVDHFLSSTARLTAAFPFQVLSDGRHIYVFRQAISSDHPDDHPDDHRYMVFVDRDGHVFTRSDPTSDPTSGKLVYVDDSGKTVFLDDSGNPDDSDNLDGSGKLAYVDALGKVVHVDVDVKAAPPRAVPIVNSTLLVDRFLLVGSELVSPYEVRYQRSRHKTRPDGRKDSIGPRDLDGNFFVEPTQELRLAANLDRGRFTALLVPTLISEVERWQFFLQNKATGAIDSLSIERAADGFFNTRGSQIFTCELHPDVFERTTGSCQRQSIKDGNKTCGEALVVRTSFEGHAGSAYELNADADHLTLSPELVVQGSFSLEMWIRPLDTGSTPIALTAPTGSAGPRAIKLSLVTRTQVQIEFTGTSSKSPVTLTLRGAVVFGEWNHLALSFDGLHYRLSVADSSDTLPLPAGTTAPELCIARFGTHTGGVRWQIDEIRVWDRVRSAAEIKADRQQRLTGLEPDLVGYWRFDEASGLMAFDQTNSARHATLDGGTWTTSDAPIGESSGVERSSFHFTTLNSSDEQKLRSIESGLASLLYFQQAPTKGGYAAKEKPVKQNGRVMLAAATKGTAANQPDDKNYIAVLDFGVSGTGRLAQMPDRVELKRVEPANGALIGQLLDVRTEVEQRVHALEEAVKNAKAVLAARQPELTKQLRIQRGAQLFWVRGYRDEVGPWKSESFDWKTPDDKTLLGSIKVGKDTTVHSDGQSFTEDVWNILGGFHELKVVVDDAALKVAKARVDQAQSDIDRLADELQRARNDPLFAAWEKAQATLAARKEELERRGAEFFVGPTPFTESIYRGMQNADHGVEGHNDQVTSIRVGADVHVTVWEHSIGDETGAHETFRSDVDLTKVFLRENLRWADNVTGIEITRDDAALQAAQARFDQAKSEFDRLTVALRAARTAAPPRNPEVPMQLVNLDSSGLSISGGLLTFAWSNDTPTLFDSATGKVALYFRGGDDQLFATYYSTLGGRARCELHYGLEGTETLESVELHASGKLPSLVAVTCLARSIGMDVHVRVSEVKVPDVKVPDVNAALCDVVLSGPLNVEETWKNVPREAERFARVLNGGVVSEFVGLAAVVSDALESASLSVPEGLTRDLEEGALLVYGDGEFHTTARAVKGAKVVTLKKSKTVPPREPLSASDEKRALFYREYDYRANASTTLVPNDLYAGSSLVQVQVVAGKAKRTLLNTQPVESVPTPTCSWTAAASGTSLYFDGKSTVAKGTDAARMAQEGDLTLEAWLRPTAVHNRARVLHQQSGNSKYLLALDETTASSALKCDGTTTVTIDGSPAVAKGSSFTIEGWIRPTSLSYNNIASCSAAGLRIALIIAYGDMYMLAIYGSGDGDSPIADVTAIMPEGDYRGQDWIHLAAVYDATLHELRLYRNGGEIAKAACAVSLDLSNAQWKLAEDFTGALDEVRVWNTARPATGLTLESTRRAVGNEPGLVACWSFEERVTKSDGAGGPEVETKHIEVYDRSKGKYGGSIVGSQAITASPLPHYRVLAGSGEKLVRAKALRAVGQWTHVAAVCREAWGLDFDGKSGMVRIDHKSQLDITGDLTLEVEIRVPSFGKDRCLIRKSAGNLVTYALWLTGEGKVRFEYTDKNGVSRSFLSIRTLNPNQSYRIAVSRKQQERHWTHLELWRRTISLSAREIVFWIDGQKEDTLYDSGIDLRQPPLTAPQVYKLLNEVETLIRAEAVVQTTTSPSYSLAPIAASKGILWLGGPSEDGKDSERYLGFLSAVRMWGKAFDAGPASVDRKADSEDLIASWAFSERSGRHTFEEKSGTSGVLQGKVGWLRNPDLTTTSVELFIDGASLSVDDVDVLADSRGGSGAQFVLGGVLREPSERSSQSPLGSSPEVVPSENRLPEELFEGELDELRVWSVRRTASEIEDNLFRRLDSELELLLAYYTFEATEPARVLDASPRANQLVLDGAPSYSISTAPIGQDAPRVRSALTGVRTPFSGPTHSSVTAQEYGVMQVDAYGNPTGSLERCYAFIDDGVWKILYGFKVGDVVREWIGQVQSAPTLIGYIEGAPPVPRENLSLKNTHAVGDLDDYNEASTVELVQADETVHTYSSSRDTGYDNKVEFSAGVVYGAKVSAGIGLEVETINTDNVAALKTSFDTSQGWLASAERHLSRKKSTAFALGLRGRPSEPTEGLGKFFPDNVGQALVKSYTNDVFALRLRSNGVLIAFQITHNKDIKQDWNLIPFAINPLYVKQGTLDGKVGLLPDPDFLNAREGNTNSSYFKPGEAYAIKTRLDNEEAALETRYAQFDAGGLGSSGKATADELARPTKRSLVNTYVWTAEGGLFAETEDTLDAFREESGGNYRFIGMAGFALENMFRISGVGIKTKLDALFGGHIQVELTKSKEESHAVSLEIKLDKVERDIYQRDGDLVKFKDGRPVREPGKVDAYRFMSFLLEPDSDHFDDFFNKVVDPIWLEQSSDSAAVALREAKNTDTKPKSWRVMYRVTYVSRILESAGDSGGDLSNALQSLEIDSNYQLVQQFDPIVEILSWPDFVDAVHRRIDSALPELRPYSSDVVQYLADYFEKSPTDEAKRPAQGGVSVTRPGALTGPFGAKPLSEVSKPLSEVSKPLFEVSKPPSEVSKPPSEVSKPPSEVSNLDQRLIALQEKVDSIADAVAAIRKSTPPPSTVPLPVAKAPVAEVPQRVVVEVLGPRAGVFHMLDVPIRLVDTRSEAPITNDLAMLTPDTALVLQIAGTAVNGVSVPAGATAVIGNLTASDAEGEGWAAVWAAGQSQPATSNLNYGAGEAIANLFVTSLDASGRMNLMCVGSATHMVVDVFGYLS